LTTADLFHASTHTNGSAKKQTPTRVTAPSIDWPTLVQQFQQALTPAKRDELAAAIAVPVSALERFSIGVSFRPQPVWTYPERDGAGNIIGVCWRDPAGKKEAVKGSKRGLCIPDGWQPDSAEPLYLVEGLSDCVAATAMGLHTIGRPSNTGGVDHLVELLRDVPNNRQIIVLAEWDAKPDGSWPGKDGAIKTAQELTARLGRPIAWALPPDRAKDLRAWVMQQQLPTDGDSLDGWCEAGERFAAAVKAQAIKNSVDVDTTAQNTGNREVVSTPRALVPPYQPFPTQLLPDPVRSYVQASAAAIGCDHAFIALPFLAAIASAVGSRCRILLKRRWSELAIIWALIIAGSGSHKSPGFDAAMYPVRRRQDKAKRLHATAMEDYEKNLEQYKADAKKWKDEGRHGPEPEKPVEPIMERTWTDNTTTEAIAAELAKQPRGLLLACDELSAWFGGMDRYSAKGGKTGADAPRWMHLHGGRSFVIDRRTGIPPTIFVRNGTVSVTGSIQPGVLRRTLTAEHHESGMAARFLFAMPPRRQKRWTEADVDEKIERDVLALFDHLYDLEPARDEDGEPIPRAVQLSTAAKHDVWIPFYNEHGAEQITLDDDLSACWSKLEGYAARLALIHHLVRVAAQDPMIINPDTVDDTSVTAGIALSHWFGAEARRVYQMLGQDEQDQAVQEVAELVRRLGGRATPRRLQQHSRKYPQAEIAENALQMLVNRGFGHWETPAPGPQGGRPAGVFVLHDVDTTPAKHSESGGCVNVNGAEEAF
jgi:hypothetical protein